MPCYVNAHLLYLIATLLNLYCAGATVIQQLPEAKNAHQNVSSPVRLQVANTPDDSQVILPVNPTLTGRHLEDNPPVHSRDNYQVDSPVDSRVHSRVVNPEVNPPVNLEVNSREHSPVESRSANLDANPPVVNPLDPVDSGKNVSVSTPASLSKGGPCLNCAEKKKKQEEAMSAAELKKLKIKMIKGQILSKLNLRARPKVHVSRSELPDILLKAEVLGQRVVRTTSRITEEVDATKKVMLFPDNANTNYSCSSETSNTSLCFNFQIPGRSLAGGVTSAELFIFKLAPSNNQSLVMTEIIWNGPNGTHQGTKKERILEIESDSERARQGWIRYDMNQTLQRWAPKPHLGHSIQITCKGKGCSPNSRLPVSVQEKYKPFLVISTGPLQTVSRKRRETVCTESSTRCCKESLTITFDEIGWGDWIIHPLNFTANYCRGTCESELDISRYHHTSVMQRYLTSLRSRKLEPSMSLCCSPSRMSSMSIIYMGQENTLQMSELSNMIVQACECA